MGVAGLWLLAAVLLVSGLKLVNVPTLWIGIVLLASIIGGQIGRLLGSYAAKALHALKLGLVDRVAGVLIGVAGALISCWLMAGLLGSTTWGSVASGIQGSSILSGMDKIMPPVPSIEARVQALLKSADFPSVFATVVAPTLPSSQRSPRRAMS